VKTSNLTRVERLPPSSVLLNSLALTLFYFIFQPRLEGQSDCRIYSLLDFGINFCVRAASVVVNSYSPYCKYTQHEECLLLGCDTGGYCMNRRFGRTHHFIFRVKIVTELVTVNVPSALHYSTLMVEVIYSSETSNLTRATRHHIPEDDTLRSRCFEILKC
jgi:hypothetical protein